MNPAEIKVLKKLIAAQGSYDRADPNYPPAEDRVYRSQDLRLVEVGAINGVNPRTAESLVKAGIAVYDMPLNANERTNSHIRFNTEE
jgi:hypothetical protein